MTETLLIVDDEKSILKALRMTLEGKFRVITAAKGLEAINLFQAERPDLILLDVGLPDISGIDVLKSVKQIDPGVPAIMVTAVEEVKTIVEAIRLGAYDYLVKPISSQELFLTVDNTLESSRLKNQIRVMQQSDAERYQYPILGQSPQVREMIAIAKKASTSVDTPVLIVGESGAGKGVLARSMHYSPDKVPGPFVTVNCGAIANELVESELFGYERGAFTGAKSDGKKGHFEASAGGTLFLDEIGAMPLSAQVKLLGVLEERIFTRVGGTKAIGISSKIIAATNIDLERAVDEGRFRKDLFFRLNVVKIVVPPLRNRRDDIFLLAEHFMNYYNKKFRKRFSRISSEAGSLLLKYSWPGNVRELRNIVERVTLLEEGDELLPKHIASIAKACEKQDSSAVPGMGDRSLDYEAASRTLIKNALIQANGNAVEAAQLLHMPVYKLRYRIKKWDISI
jgi:two-component system, NtrC family, response regulator AtoC